MRTPIRLPVFAHRILDGIVRAAAVAVSVVAAIYIAGEALDIVGPPLRPLPAAVKILFLVAWVGGAVTAAVIISVRASRWLLARIISGRCASCRDTAVPDPREIFGTRYRCVVCGAISHARTLQLELVPIFVLMALGVALLVLPFSERAREVHWSARLLMFVTGVLALEFDLLVLGVLPRLLARIPGLRDVEPAKAAVAFMILPMMAVTALAMAYDNPGRFPMGKGAAFGAMGTFFFVGVWLIASGGPPTPRRQTVAQVALALFLSAFTATAALVSFGDGWIFAPGALILGVLAGRTWWRILRPPAPPPP